MKKDEKVELNQEPKFCYCKVRVEERKKPNYYISELENLQLEDYVEVPFGQNNRRAQGVVTEIKYYSKEKVPYALNKTKKIICILTENEIHIVVEGLCMNKSMTKIIKYVGQKTSYHAEGVMISKKIEGTLIKSINIPDSVIEIASEAFKGVKMLEEVVLNEGLKIIGDEAFAETSIEKVVLPNSVEYVGVRAFKYSTGEFSSVDYHEYFLNGKIVLKKDNPTFRSDNQCIYLMHEDGTDEIVLCFEYEITSYEVPTEVTVIRESAFSGCKRLKTVILHDGLKVIGKDALNDTRLEKITIPATVEDMGNLAFKKWATPFGQVHRISMDIVAENPHYFIEDKVLYKKTEEKYELVRSYSSEETIRVKNGTIHIGEEAVIDSYKLKKVILPVSLRSIGKSSFWNCKKLVLVTVADEEYQNLEGIILPKGVTVIEDNTFGYTGFTNITLSNHIQVIKRHAFYGCKKLESVVLPEKLFSIAIYDATPGLYDTEEGQDENNWWILQDIDAGDNAFGECDNLKKYEISDENNKFATKEGVLFNKGMTTILQVPKAYTTL